MFKHLAFFFLAAAILFRVEGVTSAALPADRFALAREFARRGLHAEAVKELESVIGATGVPGDELAYRLGEGYRALGRTNESLAQSRKIIAEFPKSRYADYARLAVALASTGEERNKLLVALDRPDAPKAVRDAARYHLAVRRAQSSDPAERRQALATYLDMAGSSDPRVADEALYYAGMLCYREGRHNEAAALFARLLKADPPSRRAEDVRPYAAWSNHLIGRPAETLAIAEPLAREGKDEDAAYLVAISLRKLERRDEALKAFDAALKSFPNGRYADTLWSDRLLLLAEKGDHKAVLAALAQRGDPPQKTADRDLTLGYEAAAAVGDWTTALQYARRTAALKSSPQAARARYMSGAFEAKLGHGDEAVRIWTNLLTTQPDSPFAADALRARALEEMRLKNYRAANRSLAELARRFPDRAKDAQTLYWRGVAARGSDDLPEAEKLFAAALAAKPTPEFEREIQLERAYLLQKKGDNVGAARTMAGLLDTKVTDRLPDAELGWLAETALAQDLLDAAQSAAELLERRTKDPAWRQIAAELAGEALARKGMGDAAAAAYRRALAVDVRTDRGAQAALRLGMSEMERGRHAEAATLLTSAVDRAQTKELAGVRMRAYAALAANEDARGFEKQALGYYMLVATLFDDREVVPPAMKRAIEILRKQGKTKEADDLAADLRNRYDL